jgi:enamine deaminase RidA (YjgF/YER057c/UK114 family)
MDCLSETIRTPRRQAGARIPRRRLDGPGRAATVVRWFHGPVADELFVQCRPDAGIRDVPRQAEAMYEAILGTLASVGAGPEALVSETLFFRDVRADFEPVRAARSRMLRRDGGATTFIGQSPLGPDARLELLAVAVIPHRTDAPPALHTAGTSAVKVVRLGDQTSLHAGNIHGSGRDAFAEAYDMFRRAEGLLADAGMGVGNVVRTWIHLRDIDRDYRALNDARREFFRRCGIERPPASTGVQGSPVSDAHDFSLSLCAVASERPLDVARMHTPLLNEAPTYGADFSRGLRIADANKVMLHVSGTASIDEAGRTVHAGSFEAQVGRMLDNVASLLGEQGASFADLVSGVVYLKNPQDAPMLRGMLRARGFTGVPCALVEAPLCRPELLCETEVVAIEPVPRRVAVDGTRGAR